jgi:hypothetical protein
MQTRKADPDRIGLRLYLGERFEEFLNGGASETVLELSSFDALERGLSNGQNLL